MDHEILAELKKINSQLVQIAQLLKINQPVSKFAGFGTGSSHSSPDIASEVQKRIAEARRRAEDSMSGFQAILPPSTSE